MPGSDIKNLLNSGVSSPAIAISQKGGVHSPHHLVELREPPSSLTTLRLLLQKEENRDIKEYSEQGTTFEECIGRIATFLSIALDGYYDVPELCTVLCNSIAMRKKVGNSPHLGDARLVNAEIVERKGELSLEIAPKLPTIIKEIN